MSCGNFEKALKDFLTVIERKQNPITAHLNAGMKNNGNL